MGGWASFQEKQEEERAMGVFFAKEILEAGVQIETRGHAFYQAMAQKAQSESARKLFLELARDEKDHLRSLEELLPHLMDPPDTWEREEFACRIPRIRKGGGLEEKPRSSRDGHPGPGSGDQI